MVATLVTTYNRSRHTWRRKKKKRKKEEKREEKRKELNETKRREKTNEEKMKLAIRPAYASSIDIAKKSKNIRVSFQKHDKVAKRVSSQIPIAIEFAIVMENISP